MPLGFLKKCRQYNVTSKSLFVISVHHLLDTSTTVDCTISSESKGQECLDNVCQRLNLQEPEFFGLRYMVKGKEDELKWIDLERSLSRQLDKYAASTKIYLRVRHYVDPQRRDDLTRYYYFLQLKNDIYEGKITCELRTAILLALYCRQAEYDSHQNDKQTKDYLKKSLVLPKQFQVDNDSLLDSRIVEVLQQNAGIQHLNQSQAEEMYMQCCQQLEGYGEERFQAKDTLGNDLILGLAINGMVVMADNGRQYFPWKESQTVTIDKRTIKIEQNKADGSIVGSFIFPDTETARYFWKLCITQHKFFKRYIDEESSSMGDEESANGNSVGGGVGGGGGNSVMGGMGSVMDPYGLGDFSDSREDLLLEQQQRAIYNSAASGGALSAVNPEFVSAPALHHGMLASTNASTALMSSNISLAASHQSGGGGAGGGGGGVGVNGALHSHSVGAIAPSWLTKEYGSEYVSSQHLSNSILDTRLQQSSSCLDLSNNNSIVGSNFHSSNNIMHGHGGSMTNNNNALIGADAHERERLKAMLPTYRQAPDYETAIQLKYRTPHSLNNYPYHQLAASAVTAGPPFAAYQTGSQPDVHNAAAIYGDGVLLSHLAPHRYPDVAQPAAAMHAQHHHLAATGVAMSPNASIGAHNNNVYIDLAQRLQIVRNKPPPPYPVNRLSSSSTPDLAVASHRPLLGYRAYVSGSSPDLVSNRNFLNTQYQYGGTAGSAGQSMAGGAPNPAIMHPYPSYIGHMGHSQPYLPHGTFENLNMIEEQPSILSQLRQSALSQAAAQAATQSYEQNSPTLASNVYRPSPAPLPQPPPPQQQQQQQQSQQLPTPAPLQRNAINGSIEPIYENVPHARYTTANVADPTTQRNMDQRSSGSSQTSEAMRNRTSSIQSAPGGMHAQHQQLQQQPHQLQQHQQIPPVPTARHHHHQQQQQRQHHQHAATEVDNAGAHNLNMNKYAERASSTELQFLEPTPPQRATRAASAAPAISITAGNSNPPLIQTPPPRQHHNKTHLMKTASSVSSVDTAAAAATPTGSLTAGMRHASASTVSHDDSMLLQQQLSAMNISSTSSSMYSSTLDTTATTTHSTSTNSSAKDGKRKRLWNILGRSKTPDKQKSATLGREKATSNAKMAAKLKLSQDDINLMQRRSRVRPISGQSSKDTLCEILNEKLNDQQLFREFESIPKRREIASWECALMEENAIKNVDPNFVPYDDNRVCITPTMENRTGYVNASRISATVGTKQRFYIIAQSPQEELTTRIFWQCVWEADVYLIVQLSESLNYMPANSNQHLEFGQFQVYQEFSQTTDRCITSKLRLFHIQSRRYRSVWHLNYTNWGEQNCPREVNHFLDFLEELNSVRLASINEVPPGHNTNPPVLIHCLEGAGRSGVTLTADLLLYTLDHNEDLDIPRVVEQLRHQRNNIIPSLAQYKFIYSLLITYLKRTRLI